MVSCMRLLGIVSLTDRTSGRKEAIPNGKRIVAAIDQPILKGITVNRASQKNLTSAEVRGALDATSVIDQAIGDRCIADEKLHP